jgi:tripartite-type tricarboxylate transporter receptor subunit TctC
VLELHFTQKTAARPLVTPPEVPAERVAMLRKAFEMLAQDKEFLVEIDKAKMEFDFVPGPEIDKIVARIAATPPEIAERYGKAFSPDAK